MKKKLSSSFWFYMFMIAIVLFSVTSYGEDYDAFKNAANAVENAASEIRMGEGAVGQTLSEAMSGKHGELYKWNALDAKMSELDKTIASSLSVIGSNAGTIFKFDAAYRLPGIELGNPFEGNLNHARNKKQELLNLAKEENIKIQKLSTMIAKVDKEILNAARGLMGATVEGFLPDEVSLGGEATVIVLGAWFGPPGIAAAALAVGATYTFNSLINLYYNSKAAAEQTKALAEMKRTLEHNKRTAEQNLKVLNDGAREMLAIEQVLDKNQKKLEEMKARIEKALNEWDGQAQGAYQAKQAKLVEEAKKRASEMKKTIEISTWVYGMSPIPPIQPGEYAGEVDSFVSQMDSYSKAVEEGGEPDNFSELLSNWRNRINEKYMSQRSNYNEKYKAYEQASERCWKQLDEIGQRYGAAWSALWESLRAGSINYDEYRSRSESIRTSYNAACKAAYDALKQYGQALIAPYREMSKLSQIFYCVEDSFYSYRSRVESAVYFRTREFWREREQWSNKFSEVAVKASQSLSKVPYYTEGWKKNAKNIDSNVEYDLRWGGNVASVRSSLLATAEQLRQIDKDVKEGVKAYDKAMIEVHRVMNQGKSAMEGLITRYGKLVNHPRAGRYYIYWIGHDQEDFVPDTGETSERVKILSNYVDEVFRYKEPFYLDEAKKTDWLGLASVYEAKAKELEFYVDWADKYRYVLSKAVAQLNNISKKLTDQGFYAARGGTPSEVLAKEWLQPPWVSISQGASKYVDAEGFKQLSWAANQSWEGMTPWQKLYAGQTIFLNKINDQIQTYVNSIRSGSFQPVAEGTIKPIEDTWKGLRALCERYDKAAKPIRDKIGNSNEEISKEILAVWEVWNKMPQPSRSLVAESHGRFADASNWLKDYAYMKANALKTSLVPPNNGVAEQLDNLILSYRSELAKYKKQQEEMQRRMEEERKKREAEEKKRAEEAIRKKLEEQKTAETNLSAVRNLYSAFKNAYESRNESLVMSLISDQWESDDGTTIAELGRHMRNSFTVFNQISYSITNLNITKTGEKSFNVSYNLKITGRIFDINVKHEETSNINERVAIDKNGKAKIIRTLSGRFWQVR